MDGIHDLGGKQGYGPVDAREPEEAFHSGWEARAYGIVRAMKKAPDWTLDRFRFTREQIEPAQYLTRPYYDQWLQSYAALMVAAGLASVEEIASGHSHGEASSLGEPPTPDTVAAEQKVAVVVFERDWDKPFAFRQGQKVRARPHAHAGHTRLPGYVRGHTGTVIHVRGAFIFPDDSAAGKERAEPLYTVAFKAAELWPGEGLAHEVRLDLWESYLERS